MPPLALGTTAYRGAPPPGRGAWTRFVAGVRRLAVPRTVLLVAAVGMAVTLCFPFHDVVAQSDFDFGAHGPVVRTCRGLDDLGWGGRAIMALVVGCAAWARFAVSHRRKALVIVFFGTCFVFLSAHVAHFLIPLRTLPAGAIFDGGAVAIVLVSLGYFVRCLALLLLDGSRRFGGKG